MLIRLAVTQHAEEVTLCHCREVLTKNVSHSKARCLFRPAVSLQSAINIYGGLCHKSLRDHVQRPALYIKAAFLKLTLTSLEGLRILIKLGTASS